VCVIITVLFGLHAIVVGECGCAVEFGVGQQVCLVDDETSNRHQCQVLKSPPYHINTIEPWIEGVRRCSSVLERSKSVVQYTCIDKRNPLLDTIHQLPAVSFVLSRVELTR
jgi:hypothetical protein